MNSWEHLNELRKRAAKLAATTEAQAWGIIGIVVGYLAWAYWARKGSPWLSPGQLCLICYAVFVSVFALRVRSFRTLKKCLLSARLLFLGDIITESEYARMRSKCLRKSGAV